MTTACTIIINNRKKSVEIPNKGFYRALSKEPVAYMTSKGEVILKPVDETRLSAQKFNFSIGRNRGRVYVNGYSGRARVEITKTTSCNSFAALTAVMSDIKKGVFEAVEMMGAVCFDAFNSKPKTYTKTKGGKKPQKTRAEVLKPAVPPVIVLVDGNEKKKVAEVRRHAVPEVITYSVDHWDRRDHWVTAREGVNYTVPVISANGVTKYLRKGGTCHRHF